MTIKTHSFILSDAYITEAGDTLSEVT